MDIFLLTNPAISSLFFTNSCYYFRYDIKLLFLNAYFLLTGRNYFSLGFQFHNQRTVMLPILVALYQNSLKTRPQMAKEYHLATVKIAAKLLEEKK